MNKEGGQILVVVLAALGVVLFTVLFIVEGAQIYFRNSSYSIQAEKASALAEAGVDKGLNSLNATYGNYNGEEETFFGDGSYSVSITNTDGSSKKLTVTGYVPNKQNPKAKRTVSIKISKDMSLGADPSQLFSIVKGTYQAK